MSININPSSKFTLINPEIEQKTSKMRKMQKKSLHPDPTLEGDDKCEM